MKLWIRDEGFSLVVVMVFIALLSSLAIVAVKMSGLTASSLYSEAKGKEAYYIAEAAYQRALFKLNQGSVLPIDIVDQPFAGGTYSLNVSQASSIDDLTITAVGSFEGIEKTIVRVIPPIAKPFIIVAYAGPSDGVSGSSGDGGPALTARFNTPRGLAFDAAENLHIADTSNHRIRKVDKLTKIVTKVAGMNQGFSGDAGQATNAQLDSPEGVAVNQAGDIYIADTDNCRIRKVTAATGIITTYAGTGTCGFNPPGDGGLATDARLDSPRDVVVDSTGNVYIADTGNCRIRKVAAATSIITTYAGTGTCGGGLGDGGPATSARFNRPRGLAFDATGNLYIADTNNNRIRKINTTTQIVTTLAGSTNGFAGDGGLATSAKLRDPNGVSINQFGTIYIADTGNNRIRKVDPSTGIITTYAGTGTAGNLGDGNSPTSAQLDTPRRVKAYDDVDGHIMISDTSNNRVREVTNVY